MDLRTAKSVCAPLAWLGATIVTLFASSSSLAQSQPSPPYKINADGTAYEFTFSADNKNVQEVAVYLVSKGNISSAIGIDVSAPPGVKVTAEGGLITAKNSKGAVARGKSLSPYKFRVSGSADRMKKLSVRAAKPEDTLGFASGWFHLHKDNCSPSTSTYAAKITFKVSSLPKSVFDNGFKIQFAVKEYQYEGSRATTLKPSADGMYKGEPILLMATMAYGGEYVSIVRWSKGKIASIREIPVVKYVSYRGYNLSLARLNGTLSGGKVTYELSDGGLTYGVCLAAERRRQYANGYPR
jgi:hypothetical protein